MYSVQRIGTRVINAVERQQWWDAAGYKFEHALALTFNLGGARGRTLQNALQGTWLGHPLHPVLTDLPLGAWAVALIADGLEILRPGKYRTRRGAQRAVGIGVVGGAVAAASGLADWQHTHDEARRCGIAHALLNTAALGFNVLSWRDRRRGRHTRARASSVIGYCFAAAGGYLGADMVFRHRLGVDHSEPVSGPDRFVAVMAQSELGEGAPQRVDCDGASVVLIRHDGHIVALADRCSHLGAPMSQGWLYRGELVCPWHGSRFDPHTACPVTGPATAPLARYEVRIVAGQIELRRGDTSAVRHRSEASR